MLYHMCSHIRHTHTVMIIYFFKKIKIEVWTKLYKLFLVIVYRFSVSEYMCIIHLCVHMYVWYRFEEKVNNNLRIMLIKDWLHFTLPKFTHSYCKLESKWSLRLYFIPLACLCASKTGTFSKGNCELALTAWSHSPEIFVCFFSPSS